MNPPELSRAPLIWRVLLFLSAAAAGMLLAFVWISQASGAPTPPQSIGLVLSPGGVADMSFNYMAYQGLLKAQTDLGITPHVYNTASDADYLPRLSQCAQEGNALCVSVGFPMADATANAANTYTLTKFAIVDFSYQSYSSNLRGMIFDEAQAGYLAGTLAGRMSASGKVSAVAGMAIPPVQRFVNGYANGINCANPRATTIISYTNSFSDPNLGAQVAQDQIAAGSDVIFGVAGMTSNGAILTATQSGVWAIGVDTDQFLTVFGSGSVSGADKLLSSAMKRIDNVVYDAISDVISGAFTSGTVLYDLSVAGVGLAPFHTAGPSIPQSVRDELTLVEWALSSGSLSVDGPCLHSAMLPLVVKNRNMAPVR